MRTAAQGATYPAAGVIATSPATAPVAAPTVVGLPCFRHSGMSHPMVAAAAATWVVTKACSARPPDERALPALKPNHPNHRIAAPVITMGTLWGTNAWEPNPFRFPRYRMAASAAAPAEMWTTVPPAKSRAPRSASHPPPHTQCA